MGQSFQQALAIVLRARCASDPNLVTVKQLAKASGMSTGTADRARKGEVAISVDKLPGLANALNLTVSQLVHEIELVMLDKPQKYAELEPLRASHLVQVREPSAIPSGEMDQWISKLGDRKRKFLILLRSTLDALPDKALDAFEGMIMLMIPNPDSKKKRSNGSRTK